MSNLDRFSVPASRPGGNRQPVSVSHLRYIVETELARQLQAYQPFTAGDVTLALRQNFPKLDIIHAAVRQIVHTRMAQLTIPYRQLMQVDGDEWVLTYIPVSMTVTPPPIFQVPSPTDRADDPKPENGIREFEPLFFEIGSA